MNVYITSIGSYQPENTLSNAFMESLEIGTTAEWISERTGIEQRCSVMDSESIRMLRHGDTTAKKLFQEGKIPTIAAMSVKPWEQCLARSSWAETGFPSDTVISGTSIIDYEIPSHASIIAERLGLKGYCFDANTACSSFVTDVHIASSLAVAGKSEKIAVFNVERYTARLNFADRNSCILFGDGASAAILETSPRPGSGKALKIVDTHMDSDPEGWEHVQVPVLDFFQQNGRAVQKFAISKTCESAQKMMEKHSLAPSDIHWFIGHQANLRMLKASVKKLELQEQHLYNIDVRGNQGGAGASTVLAENWDRYRPKDRILLTVVGSGLTWGSLLLEVIEL